MEDVVLSRMEQLEHRNAASVERVMNKLKDLERRLTGLNDEDVLSALGDGGTTSENIMARAARRSRPSRPSAEFYNNGEQVKGEQLKDIGIEGLKRMVSISNLHKRAQLAREQSQKKRGSTELTGEGQGEAADGDLQSHNGELGGSVPTIHLDNDAAEKDQAKPAPKPPAGRPSQPQVRPVGLGGVASGRWSAGGARVTPTPSVPGLGNDFQGGMGADLVDQEPPMSDFVLSQSLQLNSGIMDSLRPSLQGPQAQPNAHAAPTPGTLR